MNNRKHKTMLSEHFSLEEMTYSRIAVENAIDNEPSPAARRAMWYLANRLLEPLRQFHNKPIAILSGFRNESVNRLAGGVAGSQHLKGEAVDCYIPEGPARLLEILKESGLVFDQAIVYHKRNFLHISLKEAEGNRMQILLNNRSYPVWGWWIVIGIILFWQFGFLMIKDKRRRHLLQGFAAMFGYVVPRVVADKHECIATESSYRHILVG